MDNRTTTKTLIQKRQKAARAVEKKVDTILKNWKKGPPYSTSARFMDLILDVKRQSNALAKNLEFDVDYWPKGVK